MSTEPNYDAIRAAAKNEIKVMGGHRDNWNLEQVRTIVEAVPAMCDEIKRLTEIVNAEPWDLKEWPVQTHMRSKTMDEHLAKIKCLFGKELYADLQSTNTLLREAIGNAHSFGRMSEHVIIVKMCKILKEAL